MSSLRSAGPRTVQRKRVIYSVPSSFVWSGGRASTFARGLLSFLCVRLRPSAHSMDIRLLTCLCVLHFTTQVATVLF